MTPTRTATAALVAGAIGERRLLDHPFYRRWQEGALEPGELEAYASQYRHFEAQLPDFLAAVLAQAAPGEAADLLAANLHDETNSPAPHIDLFDAFAAALGAGSADPTPATAALVACYDRYAGASTAEAVAALAAYEVQAAEVAVSKAASLREWYGLDGEGVCFWDVHASIDTAHADWVIDALDTLVCDSETALSVSEAASAVAGAWWAFLDEREAARRVAA